MAARGSQRPFPRTMLCQVEAYLIWTSSLKRDFFIENPLFRRARKLYFWMVSFLGKLTPLPSHLFQRRHDRLRALGVARCRGGQTPVPQGADGSVVSAAPRHQHRPGTPLRLDDFRSEKGRNPAARNGFDHERGVVPNFLILLPIASAGRCFPVSDPSAVRALPDGQQRVTTLHIIDIQ